MSTKSIIAEKLTGGTIKGIRCNSSSHMDCIGKTLYNYYNSPDKVKKLIALGDIATLRPTIKRCHAYHRDRGENLRITVTDSITDFFGNGYDFIYMYDRSDNNWYVVLQSDGNKVLLPDALKKRDNANIHNTTSKRTDYINWDDYFLGVADLSAKRSKDPNTQVGACIVSDDNKILSVGYNGMPIGCDDDEMPWSREGDTLNTKYAFVCHAELNAILNSRHDLKGSHIYVSLFPCNECAKAIIQSGIKEVVYTCDKYADTDGTKAAKMMFNKSGVKTRQVIPKHLVKIVESDKE